MVSRKGIKPLWETAILDKVGAELQKNLIFPMDATAPLLDKTQFSCYFNLPTFFIKSSKVRNLINAFMISFFNTPLNIRFFHRLK